MHGKSLLNQTKGESESGELPTLILLWKLKKCSVKARLKCWACLYFNKQTFSCYSFYDFSICLFSSRRVNMFLKFFHRELICSISKLIIWESIKHSSQIPYSWSLITTEELRGVWRDDSVLFPGLYPKEA